MSDMDLEILRRIEALLLSLSASKTEPDAVSFREAARRLECSTKHIGRLVRRGELMTVRLGGLVRVPVSELRRVTTPKEREVRRPRATFNAAAELEKLRLLRKGR